MTVILESAAEFIDIGRYDWYVTGTGCRLHAVLSFTDAHRAAPAAAREKE